MTARPYHDGLPPAWLREHLDDTLADFDLV
jgi:hypothetical protein